MDQYVVVFALVASVVNLSLSAGRDLRPSDHGLAYQEDSFPPAQNGYDAQEMRSFFGSTTSSSSSSTVQLPEAKNISDAVSSARAERKARHGVGRDHVRLGLLVASAVCGLTGVVLLTVSGIVFLIRLHRRRTKDEELPSTSAPTFEPIKGSG